MDQEPKTGRQSRCQACTKARKNGLRASIQAEKKLNPASTPSTVQPVSLGNLLGRLAAFLTSLIY